MTARPIRHYVIVGGGTAGWTAAAFLARLLLKPHLAGASVILIESAETGTIGVGEATIPSILDMLRFLNIDEADFVRATDATYKLAIRFKGWKQPDSDFWHPFGGLGPSVENVPLYQLWLRERVQGTNSGPVSALSIAAQLAAGDKFAKPSADTPFADGSFAYHFDAGKAARYLHGYAVAKGVRRIEGHICAVARSEAGLIDHLILKDGRKISGDFFIDCSGFAALLIGALGSDYEDWSHWLPCDRAIALPCTSVKPVTPYTLSTAAEAGWVWRIPLQSRIGNGYIYASRLVDEDKALTTLKAMLDGEPLAEPRLISFTPGRRKTSWIENCLSLGLASGFLEPLESTSIHLIFANLFRFFDHLPRTQDLAALSHAYNARCVREIEEIRDFIILHYCASARRDSEFWRYVSTMPLPPSLEAKLEAFRKHGKILGDFYDVFRPPSWICLLDGMGVVPETCDPLADLIPEEPARRILSEVRTTIRLALPSAPSHEAYLAKLLAGRPNHA